MFIVFTTFILFSYSIKLKTGGYTYFYPPSPRRHKKGPPYMLSSWLKGAMETLKVNGEALKNKKVVLRRSNEALESDGKVLNGDGMP